MKLTSLVTRGIQWWFDTPKRALEQAYQAAVKIKAIEDEHFSGNPVLPQSSTESDPVMAYFRDEVNLQLQTIKLKLAEFKASRFTVGLVDFKPFNVFKKNQQSKSPHDFQAEILAKLRFIGAVTSRYRHNTNNSLDSLPQDPSISQPAPVSPPHYTAKTKRLPYSQSQDTNKKNKNINDTLETVSDKTSVLPRSFLRTFSRIREEISPPSPESEEQVLRKYRLSRTKTAISVKFFLILIIVPLLTHQISKSLLISPLVENYFLQQKQDVIFVNKQIEEEALQELQLFQEKLHFRHLIGLDKKLTEAEMERELKNKAEEIAQFSRHQTIDAFSNIFADMSSLVAFAFIIFWSKKEIVIVKSFLDEIIYGLSDSAKAFLIILLTDMFVGYHSPHGWEIILESISRHLGLPENRDFNFLFIATFPVILDTVLKYWIFRYLNRISPSSVATYKNMNE
ncbi:MAG: proton extrusion protein PcxA [Cyanobacteria bacterium J083]|nr:MAG: proton extrusion protein PcxA [Cyanobacteria bacterium J083]